jgi:hypothetical protein
VADSLADMGRKFDELAKLLSGRAQADIMKRLALAAKKDALTAAAADVGADLAMSNWKKARLGARFDLDGENRATVKPTPSGPWKVVDEGAAAHDVTPKRALVKGKGSRKINAQIKSARFGAASGSHPLRTPFGPRWSVHIPHTRGHGTWGKASVKISRETPKRYNDEVVKALGRVF